MQLKIRNQLSATIPLTEIHEKDNTIVTFKHCGVPTCSELGQLQNLHNSSSPAVWPISSQSHPSGSEKLLPETGTFSTRKRRSQLPRSNMPKLGVSSLDAELQHFEKITTKRTGGEKK